MRTTKEYSSPVRKLLAFFERSRDGWKEKYQQVKRLARKLQGRVRTLERSREHWKERAKQLRAELTEQKTKRRPERYQRVS